MSSTTGPGATAAKSRYAAWHEHRALRLMEGTWHPFVSDERAVAHVARLRLHGLSARSVAEAAGVSLSTVSRLVWPEMRHGRSGMIRPATEAAILAVQVSATPDTRVLGAVGVGRRLHALLAIGWTRELLAHRLDVSPQRVQQWADATRVCGRVARSVDRLYRELCMTPGPSSRSRLRAARLGYAPPLAWDDDTIDDPTAQPNTSGDGVHDVDQVVVDLILTGHSHPTTTAERELLIPLLAARGHSDPQIAALCHTTDRTVLRTRRRLRVESRWAA